MIILEEVANTISPYQTERSGMVVGTNTVAVAISEIPFIKTSGTKNSCKGLVTAIGEVSINNTIRSMLFPEAQSNAVMAIGFQID